MNMLVKEKYLIFICDPTIPNICQAKKLTMGKMDSCFCDQWRGFLISLASI
jgi:hypothetical protein